MNSFHKFCLALTLLSPLLFSCSSLDRSKAPDREIASYEEDSSSVYRGQVLTEAVATTDYQRTTGLLGKLFGGVTQADVEAMDREARLKIIEKLKGDGYDLSKVVFLPSSLDVQSVDEVGSAQTRQTGVFGGVSEHTYKKYEIKLKVKLDYLYLGENPPENLERVDLQKMNVAMMNSKGGVAARIKANRENLLGLSVLAQKEGKSDIRRIRTSDLNLSSAQRLEIRDQVEKSLAQSGSKLEDQKYTLYVSLPTESGGQRSTFIVDSSDELGSKLLQEVYLKGMVSKARGGCASIMASIFKK